MKYDFVVTETVIDEQRGAVLVTVELTLADEGRLKPLDDVQLVVMRREPFKDGGYGADLVVSIDMKPAAGGKRVGRAQLLRELAERSHVSLDTHTLDGKKDALTRLHHEIPIAKFLKNAPGAAAAGEPAAAAKPAAAAQPAPAARPASAAPAAAEGKKD